MLSIYHSYACPPVSREPGLQVALLKGRLFYEIPSLRTLVRNLAEGNRVASAHMYKLVCCQLATQSTPSTNPAPQPGICFPCLLAPGPFPNYCPPIPIPPSTHLSTPLSSYPSTPPVVPSSMSPRSHPSRSNYPSSPNSPPHGCRCRSACTCCPCHEQLLLHLSCHLDLQLEYALELVHNRQNTPCLPV